MRKHISHMSYISQDFSYTKHITRNEAPVGATRSVSFWGKNLNSVSFKISLYKVLKELATGRRPTHGSSGQGITSILLSLHGTIK